MRICLPRLGVAASLILVLAGVLGVRVAQAQGSADVHAVTFKLDLTAIAATPENVGIRGNLVPLSWDATYQLVDEDADGVYVGTVVFPPSTVHVLEYKFVYGDVTWELESASNRRLVLDGEASELGIAVWDHNFPFPPDEIGTRTIAADKLLSDFRLMKRAYLALHPGLTRYQSADELAHNFDNLQRYMSTDRTIADVFLAYSKFLATIKCGHTYTNFFNQPDVIKEGLFNNPNKLPFTFRWIDGRMIATMVAPDDNRIRPGTEVLALNGASVQAIRDSLLTVVHADGGNDGKRLKELEVHPDAAYAYFDIYYPLFFQIAPRPFEVTVFARTPDGTEFNTTLQLGTPAQRAAAWSKQFGPVPTTSDDRWRFEWLDERTAYLYLGTFSTWQFEMDWRSFLAETFAEIKQRPARNLVIDIRGNGGGLTEVGETLMWHIMDRETEKPAFRQVVAYETVPADLREFVDTWDDNVFSFEGRVVPTEDGRFASARGPTVPKPMQPNPEAFDGGVYLIVDATNSSATHGLAQTIKQNGLATLVGQETGGNLRGLNGGQMFFVNLPNTLIEMDIPIFAVYPLDDQPDGGVMPDVVVHPTVDAIVGGIDIELSAVRRIIAGQ